MNTQILHMRSAFDLPAYTIPLMTQMRTKNHCSHLLNELNDPASPFSLCSHQHLHPSPSLTPVLVPPSASAATKMYLEPTHHREMTRNAWSLLRTFYIQLLNSTFVLCRIFHPAFESRDTPWTVSSCHSDSATTLAVYTHYPRLVCPLHQFHTCLS